MSRRHKHATIAIAAVIVAVFTASVVYAATGSDGLPPGTASVGATSTGTCKTGKTDYATHVDFNSTTSTTPVDLPGATVTFRQLGRNPDCVIVTFSSMAYAANDATLFVQAVLDGSGFGEPSVFQLSGDDDEDADGRWARTHAAQIAFGSVAPGIHTIQIQFWSADGSTVFLHRGLTSVTHA